MRARALVRLLYLAAVLSLPGCLVFTCSVP
jgi:hypothetical protein